MDEQHFHACHIKCIRGFADVVPSARAERAEAAIAAVRALHSPKLCTHCPESRQHYVCAACGAAVNHPCETITALDSTETVEAAPEPNAAWSAGYADAVAKLRDDERYRNWWSAADYEDDDRYWTPSARGHLADYLETVGSDAQRPEERSDEGRKKAGGVVHSGARYHVDERDGEFRPRPILSAVPVDGEERK